MRVLVIKSWNTGEILAKKKLPKHQVAQLPTNVST